MRKTNIALLVCLGISLLAPNIEAGGDTPQDQPANPPAARPASRDSQKPPSWEFEVGRLAALGALSLLQTSTSKKKPTR